MIVFRADGNPEIGSGHIMRCLSIADAFRRKGEQSVFAVADKAMRSLIEGRGYTVYVSGTDFKNMMQDAEQTVGLIHKYDARCVIVDSYYVTHAYLAELKNHTKVVYIDDLVSFAYPVDMLINYNIYADATDYQTLYGEQNAVLPTMLLGTKYVPLRSMFRDVPPVEIEETVTDVLISTGGTDHLHLCLQLLKAVKTDGSIPDLTFHFLIGAMNQDKKEIEKLAEGMSNAVLHYNVSDMKSLICSCDIAVSAAGSTLYEICACGVPLITYVLADNQYEGAKAFEEKGLALNCGDMRDADNRPGIIINRLRRLSGDMNERLRMHSRMLDMVDGNGADNIVKMIICS